MSDDKNEPKAAPRLATVTLKVDNHTHAGQPCKKGERIEVHSNKVAWLRRQGVIE